MDLSLAPVNLNEIKKSIFLKDASFSFLVKSFPFLEKIASDSWSHFKKEFKFVTFDYSQLLLNKNQSTCKDTNWHVDGESNQYLILCWGDYRTLFYKEKFEGLRPKVNYNHLISDESKVIEVSEGVPYFYDSNTVHRGRVAESEGKRVFFRVCGSNYIKPTNLFLIR